MVDQKGLPKTASPVTVSLRDLESGTLPLSTLTSAFGPTSLGILVVSDLPPKFTSLRTTVLQNASHLANLPSHQLQTLTNPSAKYLVGWSHGVETLRPGVVDVQKGSYYINCAFYHDPKLQGADAEKFPGFEEYTARNVWPEDHGLLVDGDGGGFRSKAEELIRLVIDVAVLVARACDVYAGERVEGYPKGGYLERVVRGSETTKARLLHYFPPDAAAAAVKIKTNGNMEEGKAVNGDANQDGESGTAAEDSHSATIPEQNSNGNDNEDDDDDDDDWCATHLDHGCLTGLTSAMFIDESPSTINPNDPSQQQQQQPPLTELPKSPSPLSGLYIRSRQNETVKVNIPRDCLAFQTGEALQLITKGKFRAVPHFVRGAGPDPSSTARIARNTLAVFTQPNLDEVVDLDTGLTFGEFARGVVRKNTAAG